MVDLSGQTIKGYELRERIGAGGFGAVYRAYQADLDRDVAVKVILPQHADQAEFLRRFQAEARLVARLEHVHIVPLYDFWHEPGGNVFLVMRWLRGGSLRDWLRRESLSPAQTARMVAQVAQALAAAHKVGIIHRDIKPDNILLDEDRNAYLSDFGIAKDLINSAHLTTSGTLGSPAYAAPEQFFGDVVTARTDVYSLGITIYECLTGQHPFPGSLLNHLRDPLPPVRAQRPDLPGAVDVVIGQATAKEADARYPDVLSLARAFEAALREQPPRPARPGAAPDPGRTAASGLDVALEQADGAVPPTKPIPGVQPGAAHADAASAAEPTPPHLLIPADQSATLIRDALDVPARPRKFIGRERLLRRVEALLDQGERVLLQGLGGMGKTTLAAEIVAARVAAGQGPVLWLRAGSADAPTLAEALARPFDEILAASQSDLQGPALRRLLVDQDVRLLILDDAWEFQPLRALLDVLPPDLPLLVTSRQRYPVGRILDVRELALAQSLELLSYHAGDEFTSDDAHAVRLCRMLGHHPFALEIAGKTLLVDDLSAAELVRRIEDAPQLMDLLEEYGEVGRSSIRELLDASVEPLDATERAVFLAFGGLFVPEATPDLLARIADLDAGAVRDALRGLGRRGLARRERISGSELAIFRVHEIAHSYARAHTDLDRAAVIAHCRAYTLAHQDDLDALDANRTNLLEAASAAGRAGRPDDLIVIMRALTVDSVYFKARGHDLLLLDVLDQAIAAARRADVQAETLHYLLGRRGDAHYDRGKLAAALLHYQESLDLARQLALRDREVILLCVMSKVYSDQRDFERAAALLDQANQIAHDVGDDLLVARVLENKGYHYAQAIGDFEKARDVFNQQVALAERIDNPVRLFFALFNLGAAELELGDLNPALANLQRSLDLARSQDNRLWMAHALFPMAAIYDMLGERDEAQSRFDEARTLAEQSGNLAKVNEITRYMAEAGYAVPER